MAAKNIESALDRRLTARPDPIDFRDAMYQATLVEVPKARPLADYRAAKVPILDQGAEGACTGFGLATVIHYLLRTYRRPPDRSEDEVSPRMLYEMAKRYDEWPGEEYSGSSARGALKGWHKHGVCSLEAWPYLPERKVTTTNNVLTAMRATDAAGRPLGAYYRVNHQDFVCLHSALAEVGVLYATGQVHSGWKPENVGKDGLIPFEDDVLGGHAFALVGYDEDGIWIQNSWGKGWGKSGFGRISYDDWLQNTTDVWVARLGAPVRLRTARGVARTEWAPVQPSEGYTFHEIRPHIISLGNDGVFKTSGTYGTSEADVARIVRNDIPAAIKDWSKKRLLLYAHGGLVPEQSMVQRVTDYRAAMLKAGVYPLAFIWHTDYWTSVTNALQDAVRGIRPEGFLDSTKDFLLDRLDDAMEPLARGLTGKLVWDQMKQNALAATESGAGGARITLQYIAELRDRFPDLEIHMAGHSAGAIFLAPMAYRLATELDVPISSLTLWAPACTTSLFHDKYLPLLKGPKRGIEQFALFTLTDRVEQDDNCANLYHKSLLYLVSDAFEATQRVPLMHPDGEPLLGMERYVRKDEALRAVFGLDSGKASPGCDWVLSPNTQPSGAPYASTARHHGDFDDDVPTLLATLERIAGPQSAAQPPNILKRTKSSIVDRRAAVDMATRSRSRL